MKTLKHLMAPSVFFPWLSLALCCTVSFTLSCLASSALSFEQRTLGHDFTRKVFTGARQALSSHFAQTGDVYFHKGIPHVHEEAFSDSFYQGIAKQMAPGGHVHVRGKMVKETMPWYWLAINLDPHNIENYLVAAYWLGNSLESIDKAHEVLMEARRNTSLHHEIEFEDATLYLKEKKLAKAEQVLDTALRIWPSGLDPEGEEARLDKIHILVFKALLREIDSDRDRALKYWREVKRLTPNDEQLTERIRKLKNGDHPSSLARQVLSAMIKDRGKNISCHREGHAHGHERDEHCEHSHN